MKFRAWIPELNVMIDEDFEGNDIIREDEYTWQCSPVGVFIEMYELINTEAGGEHCQYEQFVENKDASIMQFTGLQDKNGVDIYESDKCSVMYYTPFGDKTDDYYGEFVVTKWMGQFVLVSGNERVSFMDFANVVSSEYVSNLGTVREFSTTVNVKVIGNIHQE